MRRISWIAGSILSVLVFTSFVYAAPVPQLMNYQGMLRDSGGAPVSGTRGMIFSLYSSASGTTALWTETQSVDVSNGSFSAVLGSTTPLPAPLFDNAEVWLGIAVGGDPEMTPRQRITSVGYAMRAGAADSVTSFPTITATGQIISSVPTGTAPLQVSSTTMVANLNAEMVGGKRAADLWQTGGNAGTTAGTNFIGTTDNQALEMKVNGGRGLRIEPNFNTPNIIGGHSANSVTSGAYGAVIAGGGQAGAGNQVTDNFGFIGGGLRNTAGNGSGYTDDAPLAMVLGGFLNTASGGYTMVGGGSSNTASGQFATVPGGASNTASGFAATVGGGNGNNVSGDYATAGGGANHVVSARNAAVGGGYANTASAEGASVSGGWGNTASAYQATVGGGHLNISSGQYSTLGGGLQSSASGTYATVAGGQYNSAAGWQSTIGGGMSNTAVGVRSTVPGGDGNYAGGDRSFAAGQLALVRDSTMAGNTTGDQGTFVWADTAGPSFQSTGPNQFLIRSQGGVGINTNAPGGALDVNGKIVIEQKNFGGNAGLLVKGGNPGANYPNIGFSTQNTSGTDVVVAGVGATLTSNTAGSEAADLTLNTGTSMAERVRITSAGNVGIGTASPNRPLHIAGSASAEMNLQATGGMANWKTWNILVDGGGAAKQNLTFRILNDAGTGATQNSLVLWNDGNATIPGTFTSSSDIRLKTDIQPLEDSLDKVLRLRGVTYRMKDDETNTRRIGVIAQEIEQEYPELVMTDDKGMKSVAYANITPVLIEAVKALKAENDDLRKRIADLEAKVGK